jgi:hypothetical protein
MTKAKRLAERARQRVRDEGEFVPLDKAVFLWNHEPDSTGRWAEEALVVVPNEFEAVDLRYLSSSTGADTAGWPNDPANNPGFVFGNMLMKDWASKAEQIEAIAEFAKVDQLDWAREVLRGIAYEIGAFAEDDEISIWAAIESPDDVDRLKDGILERLSRGSEGEGED